MKRNLLILFLFSSLFCFSQENLIDNNPTFVKSFQGWHYGAWGNDGFTPEVNFTIEAKKGQDDNNCVKVKVKKNTKGGLGNCIYLKYMGLKLKKGKSYELSFWMKSFTALDKVHVEVYSGKDSGSSKPWAAALNTSFSYVGNSKWQHITRTFKAEELYADSKLDLKNMALLFGFDFRKGTYYIDNVNLRRID